MQQVEIYIDGSCLNNGQPDASAGWAVIIKGDTETNLSGKLPGEKQTNNRAELYALQKALEWVQEHPEVKASIYSDSKIAIDGVLGTSQRKANRDIWVEIEKLCSLVAGQLTEVKHVERNQNREADELARRSANALLIFD
jgi:ribonuclease HI